MSSDKKTVLVDPRILVHEPQMGVRLGAESISSRLFTPAAATTSQHTYTINTPSLNTIIDRSLIWESSVVLQFDIAVSVAAGGNTVTANSLAPRFGTTWGLASYPLNRLTTSQSLTINDVSTQLNTATVFPQMFRLHDSVAARQAAGGCPTMNDNVVDLRYTQTNSMVYRGLENHSSDYEPNGCFSTWEYCNADGSSFTAVAPGAQGTVTGGVANARYNANLIPTGPVADVVAPSAGSSPNTGNFTVYIRVTTREPIFVSPFACGESFGRAEEGMWGVQNISFTAQMQSPDTARIIRDLIGTGNLSIAPGTIKYSTVAAGATSGVFQNSSIRATFITPPINYPLPTKSITPYVNYQNFQFNLGQSLAANAASKFSTPSISLQSTPDMVLIWATPSLSDPNPFNLGLDSVGDFTIPIKSCSVSYTNQQGLLSGMSQHQLWKISQENGYNMTWSQWKGLMQTASGQSVAPVVTSGGALLLKFGKDITLTAGDAPGVSGSNSFSIDLDLEHYFDVRNNGTSPTITLKPIINIMTISSGFFASSGGKSTSTLTPLTETAVLEAVESAAETGVSSASAEQALSGSGMWKNLTSSYGRAKQLYAAASPYLSQIKHLAEKSGYEPAQKIARTLGYMGHGARSGGAAETGGGYGMSSRYHN